MHCIKVQDESVYGVVKLGLVAVEELIFNGLAICWVMTGLGFALYVHVCLHRRLCEKGLVKVVKK